MADLEVRIDASKAEAAVTAIGRAFQPEFFLRLVGQRQLAWINENFRREGAETAWHPMAANTRAKRGGAAKLLRDRGRLAQSFVSALRGSDTVAVGTADPRGRWHHEGTRPYTIRPKAAQVLRFMTVNGVTFRRIVHHPGLPARPLVPSERLAAALATSVIDAAVAKIVTDAEGRP